MQRAMRQITNLFKLRPDLARQFAIWVQGIDQIVELQLPIDIFERFRELWQV